MTVNLLNQARVLIREELRFLDGFVDAANLATVMHKTCPTVDFQSLVNTVIEEAIAMGGSVARSVTTPGHQSNRMVRYATFR
ncbi:MAG: hypothetical protein JNM20_19720 [Rhizobiales bacterium]|nr:hypothetical protein [Hyphomicrobiales bacterium]